MMSEKLYALSSDEIVRRRKPVANPLLCALAGGIILALTYFLVNREIDSLYLGLNMLGWCLLLGGGIFASIRALDKEGTPYDLRTGRYVKFEELYFAREEAKRVTEWCRKGDLKSLREAGKSSVSGVAVGLYTSEGGSWFGCQPFEYIELEYRPLDEFRLHRN